MNNLKLRKLRKLSSIQIKLPILHINLKPTQSLLKMKSLKILNYNRKNRKFHQSFLKLQVLNLKQKLRKNQITLKVTQLSQGIVFMLLHQLSSMVTIIANRALQDHRFIIKKYKLQQKAQIRLLKSKKKQIRLQNLFPLMKINIFSKNLITWYQFILRKIY